MKRWRARWLGIACAALVAGCLAGCSNEPSGEAPGGSAGSGASPSGGVDAELPADYTACQPPRPEMCTEEYRPVCAQRDTGVRCVTVPCDSTEWVTASNACKACSDPKVLGHRPGACPDAE